MSKWTRFVMIIFSFLLAVFSLSFIFIFLSEFLMNGMVTLILRAQKTAASRTVLIVFFAILFVLSVAALLISVMSGRLRRQRVRQTNIGSIDIGVDAIESIALNAAKASQAGVKAAKARVAPFKGDKLSVRLDIMAYSDVELPAMMNRVQERVKKDIERYTGIEVAEVLVKVARVDAIAARVDR